MTGPHDPKNALEEAVAGLAVISEELREANATFDRAVNGGSADAEHAAAMQLRGAVEAAIAAVEASLTPEDTCRYGDPDPTPSLLGEGEMCGAEDTSSGLGCCTRWRGHRGRQHVAGTGTAVVHVWPWQPGDDGRHGGQGG